MRTIEFERCRFGVELDHTVYALDLDRRVCVGGDHQEGAGRDSLAAYAATDSAWSNTPLRRR